LTAILVRIFHALPLYAKVALRVARVRTAPRINNFNRPISCRSHKHGFDLASRVCILIPIVLSRISGVDQRFGFRIGRSATVK
jgi:hypothetical protein